MAKDGHIRLNLDNSPTNQNTSYVHPIEVVEVQNLDRALPNFRTRHNHARSTKIKVSRPPVLSRIEQPNQSFLILMVSSNTAALTQVTEPAGEGQVTIHCFAALLLADDVVDMIGGKGNRTGYLAVFTAVVGSFLYLPPQDYGNVGFAHAFINRP